MSNYDQHLDEKYGPAPSQQAAMYLTTDQWVEVFAIKDHTDCQLWQAIEQAVPELAGKSFIVRSADDAIILLEE